MPEFPLVDHTVFDDLVDFIGAAAARSVLDLFLGEARALATTIAEAAPGDAAGRETVRRAAHSLKSSAGQIGAAALSAAAAAVEHSAAQAAAELPAQIAELARCAAETDAALRALPV